MNVAVSTVHTLGEIAHKKLSQTARLASHPSRANFQSPQDLVDAGLSCLLPMLETWKGYTVGGPLSALNSPDGGNKILEVYLQRWPADKKDESLAGCGLSSSGISELALFQELHSYSSVVTGHGTLLVPLAVVVGTVGVGKWNW